MIDFKSILKKKTEYCAKCNKELKYKYKPLKESNIVGKICGDCHTEMMKESIINEKNIAPKEEMDSCVICSKEINLQNEKEALKPKWQWNMERGVFLCKNCFQKKDEEFTKRVNFCAVCTKELKFIRYNPKPKWNIVGQVCKNCWDKKNSGL